jgi:hypothetical protein
MITPCWGFYFVAPMLGGRFLFLHGNRNLNPARGVMCITGGEAQCNRRITTPKNRSPARGEIIRQHNHNLTLVGQKYLHIFSGGSWFWGIFFVWRMLQGRIIFGLGILTRNGRTVKVEYTKTWFRLVFEITFFVSVYFNFEFFCLDVRVTYRVIF